MRMFLSLKNLTILNQELHTVPNLVPSGKLKESSKSFPKMTGTKTVLAQVQDFIS